MVGRTGDASPAVATPLGLGPSQNEFFVEMACLVNSERHVSDYLH